MGRTGWLLPLARLGAIVLVVGSCDAVSLFDQQSTGGSEATTIQISASGTVAEGLDVPLEATVLDGAGRVVTDAVVDWSVSDERIAAVRERGAGQATLTAKQPGTVTVSASYETAYATATIDVHNRPVDLVYGAGSDQAGFAGELLPDSLEVRAVDRRGDPVADVYVEFRVTDGGGSVAPTAVRTDVLGRARTGWRLGTAGAQTVVARASEAQAVVKQMKDSTVVFTASVTGALTALAVTPTSVSLEEGDTLTLTAAASLADGTAVADPQVTWESSDTAVASVSAAGLLHARGAGSARIVARTTSGTLLADTAMLDVAPASATVVGLQLRPDTATVDTGGARHFDAVALMSDGSEKIAVASWSATGGTVSNDGGYTAGTTTGTFRVSASTSAGLGDTAIVTVEASAPAVALVSVSPPTDTIAPGESSQLYALVRDSAGNTLTGRAVTWTSSDPSIATVDAGGLVSAIGAGQVVISATADGVSGQGRIVVTPAYAGSLTILSTSTTLNGIGDTLTLRVEARDANGALITSPDVQWISRNPDIAEVDTMGRVTAIAVGTAMIVASSLACSSDSMAMAVQSGTDGGGGGGGGASGTPLFTDDFETGDLSSSAGGFTWSNESERVYVGNAVTHSGSRSLTFFWKSHMTADGWANAELRFSFASIQELWAEYYVYFPDGTESDGKGGTLNKYVKGGSPGNDKFFTWWNSSLGYSGALAGNFSIWGTGGNVRLAWWDPTLNDQRLFGSGAFVSSDSDLGRWIRVRLHVRLADPGKANAVYQFWKDDRLLVDAQNYASYDDSSPTRVLDRGYLMGWVNNLLSSGMYGFADDTYAFIDDFKFYTSDPGW